MLKKGSIPALDLRAAPSRTACPPKSSPPGRTATTAIVSPSTGTAAIVSPSTGTAAHAAAASSPLNPSSTSPDVAFVKSITQWQEIDATDYEGIWYQAVAVLRNDHYIRVHFVGWDKNWCENIPVEDAHCRLRARRADTKFGPRGAETVRQVMALFRCAHAACIYRSQCVMQCRAQKAKLALESVRLLHAS